MIREIISQLQAGDLVFISGVGVAAITTLIQKLSSKYKPWSWLARQFGKAINAEVLEKQNALEKKIDVLEKRDNEQDEKREKEKALEARRRILSCSDEMRQGVKHSEEYFNDILDDITYYNRYCGEHKEFENERAVVAIRRIEEIYNKLFEENDFL